MAAQRSNCVALGHKKIYNYRLNNTGSGLTNYKLVMGTNALENIKNIGETRIVKTKRTNNAVRWHIWKNYNYVLFLIIATNSQDENHDLFEECKKNIRKDLIYVLVHSELGLKTKMRMLVQGLFPVWFAKRDLRKQRAALAKDTME